MKIGKATVPRTAICTSDAHTIVVRGRDLSKELIGKVGFVEHFFLLLTGQLPSAGQAAVLNATLVAIAEHGLVPSVQAARMTFAAAPDALQGAVASGILGCGSVVLGSSETAGRFYAEIAAGMAQGSGIDAAARAVMKEWRAAGQSIPGYGHPLHKERDERVNALFDVARKAGTDLDYVAIAEAAERALPEVLGKPLKLNVSGAIPAVLLGAGFPVQALKGVPILARTAGLIAHLFEEMHQPIGFALSYQATRETVYHGELPAGFGSEKMIQVLQGLKVVEQGTFITGPAAGMMLGDLGADVIKVELPGTGDPFRAFQGGLYSPHFQTYNRNKRSIELNTQRHEDLQVFDKLIADADVYIQNFRPGVADKLGAGEKRLRALNSKLIYCSISGFGATGPAASRPAYDTVAQAASGFLKLLVNPQNPRVVGPAIADALTGYYAAYGVLGALFERGRTGCGRLVEVSMLEAMAHFNLDAFTHFFQADEVMGPYSRPSVSQSYVLECADGKWIALHMSSPEKFWQGLATAIEQPELFQDPRFATREQRIANQETLIELLGGRFKQRTRDDWCSRLQGLDVPHAPMYDTSEALLDPQALHLQLTASAQHPQMGLFRTVRSPVSFDGQRALAVRPPPTLGEHNQEIRQALGRPGIPSTTETTP